MFESLKFCSQKPAKQKRLWPLVTSLQRGFPLVLTKESLTTSTTLGATGQARASPRLCPSAPGAGVASAEAVTTDNQSSIARNGSGTQSWTHHLPPGTPSREEQGGITETAGCFPSSASPTELQLPEGSESSHRKEKFPAFTRVKTF